MRDWSSSTQSPAFVKHIIKILETLLGINHFNVIIVSTAEIIYFS